MVSDNNLWSNLFKERWGSDHATFYTDSKSWKDVYEVQDRCERVGLGVKIIREGFDYYIVHQGEIQCHLGSRRQQKETNDCLFSSERDLRGESSQKETNDCSFSSERDFRGESLQKETNNCAFSSERDFRGESSLELKEPSLGILNRILFFIGDLEAASVYPKRRRLL